LAVFITDLCFIKPEKRTKQSPRRVAREQIKSHRVRNRATQCAEAHLEWEWLGCGKVAREQDKKIVPILFLV